jgi:tetratricopeptide (TPR) repeat protein
MNVHQLEQLFLQPNSPVCEPQNHLFEALLLHLDSLVSQWELHPHHDVAQNILSQINELCYGTWQQDALFSLYFTLIGETKKGQHHAYKALNLKEETHTSQSLSVDWVVQLSLAHIHTLGGHYSIAQRHLEQVKVPKRFHHLEQHAQNLQRLVYEEGVQALNLDPLQLAWKKNVLTLAHLGNFLCHSSLQGFWQCMQRSLDLLQLFASESLKMPTSHILAQCTKIQQSVYLSSVVIHAAQLEISHLEWASALVRLKRAIRRLPSQPLLWYELSHVYGMLEAHAKARQALEKTVTLMPSLSMAQLELGLTYAEEGNAFAAIERYLLAYVYAQRKESKRKIAFVIASFLESPLFIESSSHFKYEEYGALVSAEIALLLKIEQEQMMSPATLSHLAKLANTLEQHDLAMALCQLALTNDGVKNPQCVVNLAYTAWQAKALEQAIYFYKQALQLDPDNAVAHNNLGCIYFDDLNHEAKALYHFEEAVAQNPHYAMAHFNHGRVLSKQEQFSEAALAFTCAKASNAMTQELDTEEINQYLERLFNEM